MDDTTWGTGSVTYALRDRDVHTLPQSWADLGSHKRLEDGETYYAVQACYERVERRERESAASVDISESAYVWVRYVTADGERAVERKWQASVIDGGDDLTIVPRCVFNGEPANFWSSIELDDRERWVEVQFAPTGPHDADLVADLYDVDE